MKFTKNEFAFIQIVKEVEKFGKMSGLVLYKENNEVLWLALGKIEWTLLVGIHGIRKGVYFWYDKVEIEKKNWKTKISRKKIQP